MSAISLEKIESIAPDQASLVAARKLLKPNGWSGLSRDSAGLLWGECQGSGASPYRVVVSEIDAGYKCSCPSRKFPCKHSLALMWLRTEGKASFLEAEAPEWVKDWVRRRKSSTGAGTSEEAGGVARAKSLPQAATEETVEDIDPKVEARASAARERSRREREDSILGGLDDLDRWLTDQVESGLAGFAAHAGKSCRSIAQRLVDAKASGLASRLDNLASRLYTLPEHMRPTVALEQLGQLHLLAEAYRRQTSLSADLCADVRREIGWTQSRDALLSEKGAREATGFWRVVGTFSEVQPDRLRRIETWLLREGDTEGPPLAVLVDFFPVASGPSRGAYQVGERLGATLVFYPSARPLRALIKAMTSPATGCWSPVDFPIEDLTAAVAEYEEAICAVPWLNVWPMKFRNARLRRNGTTLFVCPESNEEIALPLSAKQANMAAPLLAVDSIDGFGLWDGYSFRLCFGQTSLGRWVSE